MLKKVLVALGVLVALLAGGLYLLRSSLSNPLPPSAPGPEADALARSMQAAVGHEAWEETEVVRFTFRGSHAHVWDRARGFALVAWEEDGPGDLVEVRMRLADRRAVVHRAGEEVAAPESGTWIEKAWSLWCNDTFWLNPIAKLFDAGTERGLVELDDGRRGLLVTYTTGGVTPGDAYLWILGQDDRPVAWRMWTRILPIPGIETSWEGWTELSSGAVVATRHRTPLGVLELDVETDTSRPEEDRFAPLVERLEG